MRFWVSNDIDFGWRNPVSVVVRADSKDDAVKLINEGLSLYGRRVGAGSLQEWDSSERPVLLMTSGGLGIKQTQNTKVITD